MMAGRPESEEAKMIVTTLRAIAAPAPAGMTSSEVARHLQLSRVAASRHLTRLVERGAVEVADQKRVPGVDRPVYVYRAVSVDVMPKGTIFESLNRVIEARRRRLDQG
jgi:predicted ArsR family transcriptional regulator